LAPAWRDVLVVLRRMEARGEIRGGRFATAFVGEQYALPEALDLLRLVRRSGAVDAEWDAMPPWLTGERSAALVRTGT
jgi:ATP-dependent Lhr-like helicase